MRNKTSIRLSKLHLTVMSAFISISAHAKIVADYAPDFAANIKPSGRPSVEDWGGWHYMWNPTGINIGDAANYEYLVEGAGNWRAFVAGGSNPNNGSGAVNASRLTMETDTEIAPGDNATVSTDGFEHYMIAGYTIPLGENGVASITNSSLTANTYKLLVYVNDTLITNLASTTSFDVPLGNLNRGDTVYVAIGPNGGASNSREKLGFQIDVDIIPPTKPLIDTFVATPNNLTVLGNIELSWETFFAQHLKIDDGTSTIASFTTSTHGQDYLDSGKFLVNDVSGTTTYTITGTLADDGSGEIETNRTTVTVSPATAGTDTDNDGLADLDETGTYFTNPLDRDTDGDGTPDGMEITQGLNPNSPVEYLKRPNIIFFFVDDLGYGDVGCFWQDQKSGTQKFDTPTMDLLATTGAKLTHHYVGAPVCAPSRAAFIQGRHTGHTDIRDSQFDEALPNNHNVADLLQRAGYHTIHVGKNGVAGEDEGGLEGSGSQFLEGHPLKRGFNEFFGYLFHIDGHEHYPRNGSTDKTAFIYNGYQQITNASTDLYTTDAWTAYAKKAITEEAQDGDHQPFFLYMAYETPHQKMQRPAVEYPAGGGLTGGIQWTTANDVSNQTRYASTADGTNTIDGFTHPEIDLGWPLTNQQHVGMIRRIDSSMADIMTLLEDLELDDNTLVVFSSDNGPHIENHDPRFFESYANFEGVKRDMLEAGIRVPTIVNWPGQIAGATGDTNNIHEIARPSGMWDLMPTFAEVAGVPAPSWCDGVSMLPTLTGNGVQRDKGYLYLEYRHHLTTPDWAEFSAHRGEARNDMQCVRIGDHMGLRRDIAGASDDFQIYNVVTDPSQASDLAGSQTNLQTQMKAIALQGRRPESDIVRPYDSTRIPNASRGLDPGLDYYGYEGIWSYVPEFLDLNAVMSGTTPNIDLSLRTRDDHVGLMFVGYLDIPTPGDYTFYLDSDSGATLSIHEAHVIDDDFNHDESEQSATIKLTAGLHPFRLYYRHGRAATHALDFSWAGPGISKQVIPSAHFYRLPKMNIGIDTDGTQLQFTWNSTTGQTYRIISNNSLLTPGAAWSNVSEDIPTTAPTNVLSVPLPADDAVFYRVEEE